MFELKWVYELILLLYGLSLIGYFIDFVQTNRKANRTAFWLLSMVWVLQTFFLLTQVLIDENLPIMTVYDGLYFYAWILVTFSLIINRLFRVDFLVFFTNVVGFLVVLIHLSTRAQNDLKDQGVELVNEMLVVHISLAIISYGFFTLSFIFSIMYLLQYRLLKKKKWNAKLFRLGDLTKLDHFSYISVILGVPLLLIAIILGVTWGYISPDTFYWYDSKTLGSFLVLFVYIVYLVLRVVKGYQGRSISIFNSGAFLFLLINFFLFGSLSNFHF
ncbi:cytochrome C assembly protein [Halobacillus halophilus]|uniref:HemX protein n=1 Tax=Halobacillus halophilus (strain ATCC 35676 / DSM 2266 / JCM 20832 / KCTC 3685 / LMG 17431 / NBRC 102448 / NCIMB 2269) TaxID=866895 RepID=I0JPF5_HALH3|nr:cytochrome c biogenesis protein CcsA [Halobacillus halophilus]ASF40060.1 cytochrome C assembly protein [Halobacillus halophilus]CCG46025.1 HemX protein [Halobacillus halophilus DSM 2266]